MKLFVYGTLKRGFGNNRLLADSLFLGEAITKPTYRLFDCGGFPALSKDIKSGYEVLGEIWDVIGETLELVDILEGVPFLFRRMKIEVINHSDVQAYFLSAGTSGLRECQSHSWQGPIYV